MEYLLVRGSRGADVATLKKLLVKLLGPDAQTYAGLNTGDLLDADTEAAIRRWQAGVGLVADGVVGPHCQAVLGLRDAPQFELPVSAAQVGRLFPATKPANIVRYLPYVAAALAAKGLTDRAMICAALGTIRAETEGFLPISELPSKFNTAPGGAPFALYEKPGNSLGNINANDGSKFKGRGFVQLTGRDNYQKYGQRIGVDLISLPDLANAPEIAAMLLAEFLGTKATAMRKALAAADYAAARKLVNGGSHGLARFTDVFTQASDVWPPVPKASRKAGQRKAKVAAPAVHRTLTVRKDPIDLKDRPYQPPPQSLAAAFPADAELGKYLPRYVKAGLVLDQGSEGACTGFGLACVVNYLRWAAADYPTRMDSVSPRMFYNFARRYDEYAGENYEGSSCRGALKGWFNHGVCLSDDWPYDDQKPVQPSYGFAQRATANTLGVYYRIELKSITDVQAAIQAVGAVYVSAFTHPGWDKVPNLAKPPKSHAALPVIEFDGRPSLVDGHAFALVGFNSKGFVIQNSWGNSFGAHGFAVLSYADWLANAMDAWVVSLGVPGVVEGRVKEAFARPARAGRRAGSSGWWSEDRAYQHSVVLGNDGRIRKYQTEDELSRKLLHQVAGLPDQWFRTRPANEPKRIVVYAHGGLNSEAAAIKRVRAMGRHFLDNGCYPVFLVWKTGILESIGNIVADAFSRQPARAGGVGEWISEKTDLLIESTIGRPLARPIWSEMKENAGLAFQSGRGGDLLVSALKTLRNTWGQNLELHVAGHSAGSIILGHMLTSLQSQGMADAVKTGHLFAPACTVQFANRHYAAQPDLMKKLYLHVLSDGVERNDNVAGIYRKSLLYFVSNSLETDLRTPILGLEKVGEPEYSGWDGASSTGDVLKTWREAAAEAGLERGSSRYAVVSQDKVVTAKPETWIDAAHGSFDNDVDVITATLERICGGPLAAPVDDLRGF